MKLLILLAACALSARASFESVDSVTLRPAKLYVSQCGDQGYDTSQYTCFETGNGSALCPVIYGQPTQLCGRDCYSPYQYSCNNDMLQQLPVYNGPVSLTAVRPGAPFNNAYIQAGGLHFYLNAEPSTYCPSSVPQEACATTDATIFAGSSLAVIVPGGQALYIQNDGALAFTQAHSAAMYNVSYYGGGVAYSDAGYFGPSGASWVACPTSDNVDGKGRWQVFAALPDLFFIQTCLGFYAVVENQPQGTYGAWQYV